MMTSGVSSVRRTRFLDSSVRLQALLCAAILIALTLSASSEGARRRPAKKPKKVAVHTDTTAAMAVPLPPLLSFARLDQWEQRASPDSLRGRNTIEQAAGSVETLCKYFGIGFDVTSVYRTSLSPMEWPGVFAHDLPNPRRQRSEIEALLEFNGLKHQLIMAEETSGIADALARGIASGAPILLNAPGAPVIYGYDRRENDPWWFVQIWDRREILYESERVKTIVYWADDPSANLAWTVTGPDSGASTDEAVQPDDYVWLGIVNASVTGSEASGVRPYPLSIRAFHNRLTTSDSLPALQQPISRTDPLGIRDARAVRDFAITILEHLSPMALDTSLSQPLRLALYFYNSSTQSLDRLDSLFYGAGGQGDLLARCRANWAKPARREKAATALTEMLEWEKQASQQVALALHVQAQKKR